MHIRIRCCSLRSILLVLLGSTFLFSLPAATAQDFSTGPIMTQGIPPFSLISHDGGGIDSINLGNLNVLLSIPVNGNGVYGPKVSTALEMESAFRLVLYNNGPQVIIGPSLPYNPLLPAQAFNLLAPVAQPAYAEFHNNNQCTVVANSVLDATGAFHKTPGITSTETNVVSTPGRDGWQLAAVWESTGAPCAVHYVEVAPNGTYSWANALELAGSNILVESNADLHNSTAVYSNNLNNGATSLTDAPGNLTVESSGLPATEIDYPGPNGTKSYYYPTWNQWTVNPDGNCRAYHGYYNPYTATFLSKLTLPDGSSYSFTYEQYWGNPSDYTGRLASVTLPTGATITYQYSGGTNNQGVWCDDMSAATITKTTPDGTWVFSHCEYGLATAPTTCNTTAPSGWSTNHIATTTVTAPPGDYKIYTSMYSATADPGEKLVLPVQEQTFGVTGPGCSVSAPCNLGSQTICYNGRTLSTCLNPNAVPPPTETDVYTYVPGVASPALTVHLLDSYERPTTINVYGFGGTPTSTAWDRETNIAYGSWNGSNCAPITGTIGGTTLTYPVMNRVCYKQLFVGGGTSPVSTSYSTYNATGDLITQQDTIGGKLVTTATNQYDNYGRLVSSVGPNGETTLTNYTQCSGQEPSSTSVWTAASGSSKLTTNYTSYDCTGERLLVKQDANGNPWTTSYIGDPFWRPTSTSDPLGNTTYYTYTPAGSGTNATQDVKLTVASGSVEETLTQMDSMGRQQLSQVMLNGTSNYSITETDYDANERVKRVTLPYTATAGTLNSTVDGFKYTYDGLDRPLTVVGPAYSGTVPGTTKTYSYNANDTLVTVSPAPSGESVKATQTELNGLGEVTSVCEVTSMTGSSGCLQSNTEAGFLTTYTYYPGGKLQTATQNAKGTTTQARSFTYDNSNTGRVLTSSTPEAGTYATTYDSDPSGYCSSFTGFPVKTVDNGGGTACMAYDLADRLVGMTYPTGLNSGNTPSKTFVYDSTSNSNINCSATNQAGAVAEAFTGPTGSKLTDEGFCYDQDGRPTDTFLWTSTGYNSYQHIVESYYPDGQASALSVPTQTISYTLDANARVYSAKASSGQKTVLTSATYWDNGLPDVIKLGSGDKSTYTPYANLEPNTAVHTIGTSNNNKITHTLSWNSNGSLASLATTDQFYPANSLTCSFTYDDVERLLTDNCGTTWNESSS